MARGQAQKRNRSQAACRSSTAGMRVSNLSCSARLSSSCRCTNASLPSGVPKTRGPCWSGRRDQSPVHATASESPCAFLETRKAFDVAWRDGAGVQGGEWHLIDDLIADRIATVRVCCLLSELWDVDEGIGQGAVYFVLASAINRACRGASCRASSSSALCVKILLSADDIVIRQ